MNGVRASVVIPAHDAAATIAEQLDALVAQAPADVEIVVVDNGSTDGTAAVAEAYARRNPNVRVVDARDGEGPSYARNAGARAAGGGLLLFCDADDVVAEGWVDAMLAGLASHDYVGGPLEVDRLNPGWLADGRGRWGVDRPGRFGNVAFAHGCNLGIRRATYLGAGGLDERLRTGEEIDLAIRLRRAGTLMEFVPTAVVHYRYRPELAALARQAFAYGRSVPALRRAAAGLPGFAPPRGTFRRSLWLAAHLYALFDRAGRVRWVWLAAATAGQLAGRLAPGRGPARRRNPRGNLPDLPRS